MFKKLFLVYILFFQISFCADYSFEERQKIVQDIKSVVLLEELIATSIENYIETNLAIPQSLEDISFVQENINSSLFKDFSINVINRELIINYSLENVITDESLIKLYESDSFRKNTFFNKISKDIRIILSSDKSKHYYGLIKYQGSDILDCTTTKICKDNFNIKIRDGISSSSNILYEYEINNYSVGPMAINDDETLHTSEEFSLIPNGMILINSKGMKYIKDSDLINKIGG